eukprot:CAMPEP_0170184458 /NCGR_PEP_ID=MMETSP0040_2-20121228/33691_1 /TAXON_ID=641309 /ORGANISM="Lotharella oceanica, Strain CCMP622" /LENGTH=64 /DNA_ID=CAMNT_0010430537 /DNA_START=273 /DNA_END=467 /DNA_ORIENTATION=-
MAPSRGLASGCDTPNSTTPGPKSRGGGARGRAPRKPEEMTANWFEGMPQTLMLSSWPLSTKTAS